MSSLCAVGSVSALETIIYRFSQIKFIFSFVICLLLASPFSPFLIIRFDGLRLAVPMKAILINSNGFDFCNFIALNCPMTTSFITQRSRTLCDGIGMCLVQIVPIHPSVRPSVALRSLSPPTIVRETLRKWKIETKNGSNKARQKRENFLSVIIQIATHSFSVWLVDLLIPRSFHFYSDKTRQRRRACSTLAVRSWDVIDGLLNCN